jgi:PEP-CTERM motif
MGVSGRFFPSLAIVIAFSALSYANSTVELREGSGALLGPNTMMSLSGAAAMAVGSESISRAPTGNMVASEIATMTVRRTVGMDDTRGGSVQIAGRWTWTNSIPEPSTLALFGTGALTLGGVIRRKLI